MNTQEIIAMINSPEYVYGAPLMQSRNGGKVHFAECGQRSLYVHMLKDTDTLTRAQLVEKFGTDLCRYCFPELQNIAPVAKVEEKKADENICPGSYTQDWKHGEPERKTYYNPGGTCGHCGKWAGFVSRYNPAIRKHKIK